MANHFACVHCGGVDPRAGRFVCDVDGCRKVYKRQCDLTTHNAIKHDGRTFPCDICWREFARRSALRLHVQSVHMGEKPYECDHCGERFAQRGHRTFHIRALHTQEGAQRQKVTENALAAALTDAGIDHRREFHVDFKCVDSGNRDHFARIDFVHIANGTVVYVENDERQHDWIDTTCDCKRMAEIVETQAIGGNALPVAFVRFNPHAFRVDGVVRHIKQRDRRARLVAELEDASSPIYAKRSPLQILHMFYDTIGGEPVVLEDYGHLRECVLPCVTTAVK